MPTTRTLKLVTVVLLYALALPAAPAPLGAGEGGVGGDQAERPAHAAEASRAGEGGVGAGDGSSGGSGNDSGESGQVQVYYFWGDGCPVCDRQAEFLDELERELPQAVVHRFEVWYDEDNAELLLTIAEQHGFEARAVPVTVVGDRHWIGFNPQFADQIREKVEESIEAGRRDAGAELFPGQDPALGEAGGIRLPIIGELGLAAQPALMFTAVIAFVDGFNPCSLWVLTMLLALVTYTRSRFKTLVVGTTFLLVTAVVYGGFIAGVFSAFALVQHIGWVRGITAVIALGFGAVNVKDYFRFGRGVSLSISADHKTGIAARIRDLVRGERSLAGMIAVTAAMAAGIAVVELPCTAGFPVIWSGILAERQVAGAVFGALLAVYILVYLLIELAVFLVAVFGLHAARMTEHYARVLKLIGGVIMLTLGFVLVFAPDTMHSVGSSVSVFAGALAASLVILGAHRVLVARVRS